MTERQIKEFQKKLLSWFKSDGRKFPWRRSRLSVYQLIISETLLQRTKAQTVAKFYSRFLHAFPTWSKLDSSNSRTLEGILRPIGLQKQRAKRLKGLAREMVHRKGRIPKDRIELESIPFVGQYIANAIELLVFNKCSPLIDVNMSRVLERYFSERKMADIRYDPMLQNLAIRIVQHTNSRNLNWAILDFAALVCTARRPKCKSCFLASKCSLFLKNAQKAIND